MPDNNKPLGGPLTPEQQLFKNIADKQATDLKLGKVEQPKPQSQPYTPSGKVKEGMESAQPIDKKGVTIDPDMYARAAKNLSGSNTNVFNVAEASGMFAEKAPVFTNYGEYDIDKNININLDTTQEQLDMMRADEQSLGGEVLNSALGAIVKAPIKLASSFSSFLVDTDSYSKLNDSMWNQVMKNSTETLNQMDEKVGDVFKVHGADDQADGTFGNREWWMKNAVQEGGAYLLGFMSAGAGVSSLMARVAQGSSAALSGLATYAYNTASVGGKIEKAAIAARAMLPSIRMGLKGAGELTSAFMLSDLEASAEALSVADEVYKQKYAEFLEKGGYNSDGFVPQSVQEEADKYAGQIAANAGDVTRNIGRMTMVFNLTGLKYFTGSQLSTTKYVKHTLAKAIKDVALEIPQEAGEELLMGVGGTLARRQASENLTAENGGGMFSNSHLVSDTWNHVFSQQGAEEAVLGGVLGGGFGAVGELVKAKSGANKANNDLADFQASNTTTEGYLKQLLDPTSNIAQSIKNLKNLSDTQADLFPKITEAHLKGDEVSADNMRAQLLQFQAYDYFQKGMGDQLNATMEALTSDKQLAEETFGPDYHEKLAEAKKIIKEAQGVYDTEVPFAPAGSEKMLYHNILNRNNISKAIHTVRTDLAKERVQYTQDLANYTADVLGVPSMDGLSYDIAKQEEEFKASQPLSLQKVAENETKLTELQSQFKQNQAQHALIRKGKYKEFEQAAKIQGTEEYVKPQVREEAKLTKEQEIANNTKAQKAQSLANNLSDEESRNEIEKRKDEIDFQVKIGELTESEGEVRKRELDELREDVFQRSTEQAKGSVEDYANKKVFINGVEGVIEIPNIDTVLFNGEKLVGVTYDSEASSLIRVPVRQERTSASEQVKSKYSVNNVTEDTVTVNGVDYIINVDSRGNIKSISPTNKPFQNIKNEKLIVAVEIERNKLSYNELSSTPENTIAETVETRLVDNYITREISSIYEDDMTDEIGNSLDKLYNKEELSDYEYLTLEKWSESVESKLYDLLAKPKFSGNEELENAIFNNQLILKELYEHSNNKNEKRVEQAIVEQHTKRRVKKPSKQGYKSSVEEIEELPIATSTTISNEAFFEGLNGGFDLEADDLSDNAFFGGIDLDSELGIFGDDQAMEELPEPVNAEENTEYIEAKKAGNTIPKTKTAVYSSMKKALPIEIVKSVTLLKKTPKLLSGGSEIMYSMKSILDKTDIEDELLINWIGINKDRIDSTSIVSTKQLTRVIQNSYDQRIKQATPFLKNEAEVQFKEWLLALENYPVAFKDLMLKYAIKNLINPARRDKFIVAISKVALANTSLLINNQPNKLNQIGKLYNNELISLTSDATDHEPSESGLGYWVKVDKTSKSNTEAHKANADILKKLSPHTWCTSGDSMASNKVEYYDNYILVVGGNTVAGIESTGIVNPLTGLIKVDDVTSFNNNRVASIDHLDDILAFFKKHNLDTSERSIVEAMKAREEGKVDEDLRDKEESYNYYDFFDEAEDRYIMEQQQHQEYLDELMRDYYEESNVPPFEARSKEEFFDNIKYEEEKGLSLYHIDFSQLSLDVINDRDVAEVLVRIKPHNIALIDKASPYYLDLSHQVMRKEPYLFEIFSEEAKNDDFNIRLYKEYQELTSELPFSKTVNDLVQGYYDSSTDKVVVIYSNVSEVEAPKVAIHEVAHRGMVRMAKELGGVNELHSVLKGARSRFMEKMPELLARTGHTSLDNLMKDYGFEMVDGNLTKEGEIKLYQELAARWAETLIDKPKPNWWKRFTSSLRNWIKEFTGIELNDKQIDELVGGFVKYGTMTTDELESLENNETIDTAPSVIPPKKLVYIPTSISVKTVDSKDNVFNNEASSEGGDLGKTVDKVQATNVLDNGPNSIQAGTKLFITPTTFNGEVAYQFKTEDGRLAGYLHKPEYVRTSRLATEKMTEEEREAVIAEQTTTLKDMWDKLNTYFSVESNKAYETVVTDKTKGTLNTTKGKLDRVGSSILTDPRVVVFPVIKSEESDLNTIQLAQKSIAMYLDDMEGVLEEGALDNVLENKNVAGNHLILVPTAKRTAGRIVYEYALTQKTVLSAPGNEDIKALVEKVIDNYLSGNGSTKDQEFVKDMLSSEIEFGTYPDKTRLKVKVGKGDKAALITLTNKLALDNIAIQLPLNFKHNESVTIAGETFIPQEFLGKSLESKLSFAVLEDANKTNSYVHNPVLSFKPIELKTDIAASQESQLEEAPVKKPKPRSTTKLASPLKTTNILSELDALPKDKGFNIIKKEALVKALTINIFSFITNKGKDQTVSEILSEIKVELEARKEFLEYLVENGLDEDDLAAGEVDDKEYNQSLVDNIQYVLDNYEVLSNNALRSLKDTGYDLKKDTRDLSKAEIIKKPEDVESSSIDEDTTDTTNSAKVDKPEEAVSSKFDKMMFEESPYEISSAFVRTWLNTIGSGKRSLIGGTESYGGKKLFGELMNLFKDRVFEESDFKAVIEKEGLSKPHFADLAKKFETLPKHYKKQILNSLHITKANFRASVGGKVFDSNRNTKEIQLKDMVKQGIQNLLEEGVAGGFNTLTLSGEAYLKAVQRLSENTEKGVSLDFNKVVKAFEGIGVPVTVDVLERLKKDGKSFKKGLLDAIISNIDEALNVRTLDEVKMNDVMFNRLIGAPNADVKSNLQEYIIESDGDSIVTIEGKKIYPFGIHHFTSILWSKLKDPKIGNALAEQLLSVPFISENTWLKDKTYGSIIYMDGGAVINKEALVRLAERQGPQEARAILTKSGKPKTYDQLTTEGKLAVKFEFFKNSKSDDKYSWWSSAKSDKSLVIGVEASKAPKDKQAMIQSVANIIAAEAKRINQYAKLPKEKGVNGSVFYLFPQLNEMGELFRVTENGREVKNELLAPGYEGLKKYAAKIVGEEYSKALEMLEHPLVPFRDFEKFELARFVVSELVNNYNYQSLVSGDPAFFAKTNKDGSVNIEKTSANLFKRLTRDIATAKRGRGEYETLRVFTFKEPEGDNLVSKNIGQLEAALGDQASGYRNVQAADAQGYCTFKEYVDLLWGDGLIEEEQRNLMVQEFNDHWKSQGTVKGFVLSEKAGKDILFKPRKPVTIGNKYIKTGVDASGKDVGVNRPIYVKYSIFPLMSSIIEGDERLVRMADFMEKNDLHRAVAESGFKVGMSKPVDLEAKEIVFNKEEHLTEVDRDMDGNQLDIPYDETKEAILQGTQLLKLVFDSVDDAELKETFYKNQAQLLEQGNEEYKASMGITEVSPGVHKVTDMNKFKSQLEKALSDSFENPNDKASFESKGGQFNLPLFFNKLGPKIESTLIQGFKKNVLKNKLGGRSFVLVSEYLFKGNSDAILKTSSYDPERGLLPARLMKDGREATPEEIKAHYANPTENPLTVAPAQVMVAWNFKDERGNILDINKFKKDGKIDMSKISPDMLKMIGYRIPTQGHNSMSVCEIVGFLPVYMGDSIIAPKDFTVQMGSDFDIDKIFMHFKYSKVVKGVLVANDKYALENSIIDNYNSVLSKPEVFRKMMLPLDFGRLPEIVAELKKNPRFQDEKGSILSPVTQVNNYETGTAGKTGVGMSSLLSVFASIVQGTFFSLDESSVFSVEHNGKVMDLTDLASPNQVLDPTKSKNMVISAFQSASVDNIKELYIKPVNYNSKTHPILISMSMLGLDEDWISYMMVQDPLMMREVSNDYKIPQLKPLSLELLKKAALTPEMLTIDEKAHVKHYYEKALLIGDEISKISGLVNITTNGFGAYIEDIDYLEQTSSVLFTSFTLSEAGMYSVVNDPFWGKGYQYMRQTKDIINQFFPVGTELYKAVMAKGNGEMEYPTKEFKKALKNFVKAYMMSDLSMYEGSVVAQRQRLFFGENSLAHRASVLKAANPENSFLQSLSFTYSNNPSKPSLVKYVGKSLTVTEKFVWQTQLKEMFESENPIEAEFAKDFIIYQYAAGGIQVPTSAISMLPADLVNKMGLANDLSNINWVKDEAVVNDIIGQFKQHHGAKFNIKVDKKGFFGMMEVVKNTKPTVVKVEESLPVVSSDRQESSESALFSISFKSDINTSVKNLFTVTPKQSVDKKAVIKASIATQYIGFGEGIEGSSTELYRNQAGDYANTTEYSSNDVVFVSIGGKRGSEKLRKAQQDRTIRLATYAIEKGATLITDNKSYVESSDYNEGEKRLSEALKEAGYSYSEKTISGQTLGFWNKSAINDYSGIVENLGTVEPTTVTYSNDMEDEGEYNMATGEITINNSLSDEDKARVLVHETIHHVLANTIKQYEDGTLTGDAKRAVARMNNLFEFAKSKADSKHNTFSNLQEFVAEMVSNKEMQEWANGVKQDVENTIWTKFKKFAFNILKSLALVDLNEDSLLEEFLDTYLEVKEYRVSGKSKGKLQSPAKTTKYDKADVLKRVKDVLDESRAFELYNRFREQTKLNPRDVNFLNENDPNKYYYTSKRETKGSLLTIVNSVDVDKLGQWLEAREKSLRETSYTQKDITEIIKDVANSDRPLAGLAKHLQKYTGLVKPKIEFTTSLKMSDRGSENGFGTISAGSYNNETNVITVNVGVNHPKGLEHTIVHEYMHALTAHQIRIGGPKIDALKDLYEVAKDKLKDKAMHPNARYALLDWDEFIVGIFTNGKFIKELQSLPATGVKYKNLWENVLDALLNVLGITKADSFYEEAFALATNIVEDQISYSEMMERQKEFANFVEKASVSEYTKEIAKLMSKSEWNSLSVQEQQRIKNCN